MIVLVPVLAALLAFGIPMLAVALVHVDWRNPRIRRGRRVTLLAHTYEERHQGKPVHCTRARIEYVRDYDGARGVFHTYHPDGDKKLLLTVSDWHYRDEGVTWCFGWDGAAVNALSVVARTVAGGMIAGEDITVLSRVGHELIPEHGRVTQIRVRDYRYAGSDAESFGWVNTEGYTFFARLAREGVDWIYGRHARDSAAVQAMLVAHALVLEF